MEQEQRIREFEERREEELEMEQAKREMEELDKGIEKFKGLKLVKVSGGESKVKNEKIQVDEIQEYLRNRGGLLFDNDGYNITDIYFDNNEGDIIAQTEHQGMKIVIDNLDELYKRMMLLKFLSREKRGLGHLNWKIKEYKDYIQNSKDEKTKERTKTGNELQQVVVDRIAAEKFLVEHEIKKLERIKDILNHYENEIKNNKLYTMKYYNEKYEELGRSEL